MSNTITEAINFIKRIENGASIEAHVALQHIRLLIAHIEGKPVATVEVAPASVAPIPSISPNTSAVLSEQSTEEIAPVTAANDSKKK